MCLLPISLRISFEDDIKRKVQTRTKYSNFVPVAISTDRID